MDKMLKTMFEELRAELRKELREDIRTMLASKRRSPVTASPAAVATAAEAAQPAPAPAIAEVSMEDMLCQRYDAFPKEIRQALRAKYIPKQAGLLSKEQKVMIMQQCIVKPKPDAPAQAHEDASLIPLTESEDEESKDKEPHEKETEEKAMEKEKTPPLGTDGFYLQCSQLPIDFGTQVVQPPAIESGGWRKRRLPTSSQVPPPTPCSKRAAEPAMDKTDEPPAKKQASSTSATDFIQIDWEKVLSK